ncbi:MAG: IPT/TIG domain-containing protein, partial [Planctomycetota bacterium]
MTTVHRFVAFLMLLLSLTLAPLNITHAAPSAPPTISGFWPGDAPPGTLVFVFGTNFDTAFRGSQVAVNGVSAPIVQVLDATLLVFMLPAGDTAGPITVSTVAGIGTSATKFGPDPSANPIAINGFWPSEVAPGSLVFVFGKGFVWGSTKVKLNDQDAPIVQIIDSGFLFFMVPPDATTGTITVTTPAGVVVTVELLAVRHSGSVTLIHMGDLHGHTVPRPNLRSSGTGKMEGGLARMFNRIQQIRGNTMMSGKSTSLLVNTGDTIQGSGEALYTRGQAL